MKKDPEFSCSMCGTIWQKSGKTNCWSTDVKNRAPRPDYCPSNDFDDIIQDAICILKEDSEDAAMARVASRIEGMCYEPIMGSNAVNARWTRVEETVAFAKMMGYTKIGLATCIGLLDETQKLGAVLKAQGLRPLSVCCKTGSIDKLDLGLQESDKVRPATFEPACNPIAQAKLMNRAGTDMNVIVGLCIGHDILFTRHSDAPVTTLVVKDRVTGHNPVSVLYGQNFYYRRLQVQPVEIKEQKKRRAR